MNAAEQTIVTSFAVVGLSTYLGTIAAGNVPTIRPAIGIVVAGGVLLVAANGPAGDLARRFAVLAATTAVLTSGYYVARSLGRYFNAPSLT